MAGTLPTYLQLPKTGEVYSTQTSLQQPVSFQSAIPQMSSLQAGILQAQQPLVNALSGAPTQSTLGVNTSSQVAQAEQPTQNLQMPAPFSPSSGGGSGTVGPSAYERQLAAEKAALMEQQKQQGLQFADQSYNDMIANLNNQEGQVRSNLSSGQDYINQLRNSNVSDLNLQTDLSKRQARQSYQDALLQNRIRARALGGAASSGFLDLASRLDQALAGNLTNIDINSGSALNKVKLTADKALTDLQMEMEKNLNEIANQKNLSMRERDKAKAQIQMEAAQGALDIKSWLDGKIRTVSSSAPSIASQAAAYKSNLLGQFGQEIGGIQGPKITEDPKFAESARRYAPAFASVGVPLSELYGYYTVPLTEEEKLNQLRNQEFYKSNGRYLGEQGTNN